MRRFLDQVCIWQLSPGASVTLWSHTHRCTSWKPVTHSLTLWQETAMHTLITAHTLFFKPLGTGLSEVTIWQLSFFIFISILSAFPDFTNLPYTIRADYRRGWSDVQACPLSKTSFQCGGTLSKSTHLQKGTQSQRNPARLTYFNTRYLKYVFIYINAIWLDFVPIFALIQNDTVSILFSDKKEM